MQIVKRMLLFIVLIVALLMTQAALAEVVEVATEVAAPTAEEAAKAIDLTPVINAAIAFLAEVLMAVIAAYVVPPIRAWMHEKMTKVQQEKMIELIRQLVLAAEQLVVGKGLGSTKLRYVEDELEARGYKVDHMLIEAAVKQMNDLTFGLFSQEEEAEEPEEELEKEVE